MHLPSRQRAAHRRPATNDRESTMSEHVYKSVELTGSSPKSIEEAVRNAVDRGSRTLRNMRWFEVVDVRGHIEEGAIGHWQVTVKLGFTLED
jgi:dodecin